MPETQSEGGRNEVKFAIRGVRFTVLQLSLPTPPPHSQASQHVSPPQAPQLPVFTPVPLLPLFLPISILLTTLVMHVRFHPSLTTALPVRKSLSPRRQSRLNPLSFANMKRSMLFAKPDQVLASSKLRPTKMRCVDLWSKRMKKEAVQVMLAQKDPRIQKFHWRTKVFKDWNPPEEGDVTLRLSKYIDEVRTRSYHEGFHPEGVSLSMCEERLLGCDKLKREIQDGLRSIKADLGAKRREAKQWQSMESDDNTMKMFIQGEVDQFRNKRQVSVPELLRKTSGPKPAKKLARLGLSFYIARRRRPT